MYIIIGAVGSGKTNLLLRCLQGDKTVGIPAFTDIHLIYRMPQNEYSSLLNTATNVTYSSELPERDMLENSALVKNKEKLSAIAFDDVDVTGSTDQMNRVADLFTKIARHTNTSLFWIGHDLTLHSRQNTLLQRNCSHIVLCRLPDLATIRYLGYRLFQNGAFLLDAYRKAVESKKFGYLIINLNEIDPTKKVRESFLNTAPSKYNV